MSDIPRRLRALVILDEAGSDNPLGREAAAEIERLNAEIDRLQHEIKHLAEQCSTLLRENER